MKRKIKHVYVSRDGTMYTVSGKKARWPDIASDAKFHHEHAKRRHRAKGKHR